MISKELCEFLKAWRNWVDLGAPHMDPFSITAGLCAGVVIYWHVVPGRASLIKRELYILLQKDFGCCHYPFGKDNYESRARLCTQHKDPARLAWVDKKIKEYEEAQK